MTDSFVSRYRHRLSDVERWCLRSEELELVKDAANKDGDRAVYAHAAWVQWSKQAHERSQS